jgi:hypothetical protein
VLKSGVFIASQHFNDRRSSIHAPCKATGLADEANRTAQLKIQPTKRLNRISG